MINAFLREVQVKNRVIINCDVFVQRRSLVIINKTLGSEGKEFSHFSRKIGKILGIFEILLILYLARVRYELLT